MTIEQTLRELVKVNGLRKTARDLGIDPMSLYRSLKDGSNLGLNRIRAILDLLGYELTIQKKGGERVHTKSTRKSKNKKVK